MNQLEERKRIEVVAAIICHNGRTLATQRGYGDMKDGWEFPGGKIELGETREQALRREIAEELRCGIDVGDLLCTIEHDYDTFHLTMYCFMCTITQGEPTLIEHEAARWLAPSELNAVDWLPADESIIPLLQNRLREE